MNEASNPFSGRLRVRACGLVVQNGRLLLVKINSPTRTEPFWMPPGGGVSFREEAGQAAAREVKEETGLEVAADETVFVSEYISGQWHAIELYFRCRLISGEAKLGHDPEITAERQMLEDIGWFTPLEMQQMPVFPQFVKEQAEALISGQPMPLRFIRQQPHSPDS